MKPATSPDKTQLFGLRVQQLMYFYERPIEDFARKLTVDPAQIARIIADETVPSTAVERHDYLTSPAVAPFR